MTRTGLSWWGRAGLALLVVHITLLFFPPIPPLTKGSLWSYLAGYATVILFLLELRQQRGRLIAVWAARSAAQRLMFGLGAAIGALILASLVRLASPDLFARLSREEGLWEPITLFCYVGSALILFNASRDLVDASRKHWRLVAGAYLLFSLEEVDYFGIFGGIIGRVQGVYVGSLHDLIRLAAEDLLSATAWTLIAAAFVLAVAALYWTGYLQPRALVDLMTSIDFLWVVLGLGFLFAASSVEAHLFGLRTSGPTLEESLELSGAICFASYAVQIASRVGRERNSAQRADDGLDPA